MFEQYRETKLEDYPVDHLVRYFYAANLFAGKKVLDIACGSGYGSKILAMAGCKVTGIDREQAAIDIANEYFYHKNIKYLLTKAENVIQQEFDAVVCIGTMEHLQDPGLIFKQLKTKYLLISVPNEDQVSWSPAEEYHFKHYTPKQLGDLLFSNGYDVEQVLGQKDKVSGVKPELCPRNFMVLAIKRDN